MNSKLFQLQQNYQYLLQEKQPHQTSKFLVCSTQSSSWDSKKEEIVSFVEKICRIFNVNLFEYQNCIEKLESMKYEHENLVRIEQVQKSIFEFVKSTYQEKSTLHLEEVSEKNIFSLLSELITENSSSHKIFDSSLDSLKTFTLKSPEKNAEKYFSPAGSPASLHALKMVSNQDCLEFIQHFCKLFD
eukprot:Sdes_comp24178_c0_seq1m22202